MPNFSCPSREIHKMVPGHLVNTPPSCLLSHPPPPHPVPFAASTTPSSTFCSLHHPIQYILQPPPPHPVHFAASTTPSSTFCGLHHPIQYLFQPPPPHPIPFAALNGTPWMMVMKPDHSRQKTSWSDPCWAHSSYFIHPGTDKIVLICSSFLSLPLTNTYVATTS